MSRCVQTSESAPTVRLNLVNEHYLGILVICKLLNEKIKKKSKTQN
jgi:hypothetical protein